MDRYPTRSQQLRKIVRFLKVAPPVAGLFLCAVVGFLGLCLLFVGLCLLFAVLCCVIAVVAVVCGTPALVVVVLTALVGFVHPGAGRKLRDWRRPLARRLGRWLESAGDAVFAGSDRVFDGADRVFDGADRLFDRLEALVA